MHVEIKIQRVKRLRYMQMSVNGDARLFLLFNRSYPRGNGLWVFDCLDDPFRELLNMSDVKIQWCFDVCSHVLMNIPTHVNKVVNDYVI